MQLPSNECPEYAAQTGTCGTYSLPDPALTADSTDNAAPGLWKTLQGFMGAFPQYSKTEFNFATESYGGHYGPVYNEYFVEQNKKIAKGQLSGAKKIDLKSVTVGNGWYGKLKRWMLHFTWHLILPPCPPLAHVLTLYPL